MNIGQVRVLSYLLPTFTTIIAFVSTFRSFLTAFILAGGMLLLVGTHLNKKTYSLSGFFFIVFFFFFIHRGMAINVLTVALLVTVFFMAYLSWTFSVKKMVQDRLRDQHEGSTGREILSEVERDISRELLSNGLLGIGVTIIGSLIAIYSYVGLPRSSVIYVPLVLLFTAVGFGLIYVIVWYIPEMNDKKNILI